MSSTSSLPLVHLNSQGQGVVTCPQCTKKSQVSAAAYRDLHVPVKITCPCGHRFSMMCNTRHFYRKDVHLSGRYGLAGEARKRRMTVVNLSMTGANLYTLLPHTLHVDDVVEIEFCLDDQQQTEMHHEAIIRWVEDKHIGAEFCDLQAYERELGFYLRPA